MKKSLFIFALCLLLGQARAQDFQSNFVFPNTQVNDIFAISCGDTYITGRFSGTAQIGTFTLVTTSAYSAFAAKIDAQHQVVWAKSIAPPGATGSGDGTHIAVNSKGEALVTGSSKKAFICKLDGQGNLMVFNEYGQLGTSIFFSDLAVNADDEVVVAGSYFGVVQLNNLQLDSLGKREAFVAKLSSDLAQVLWANTDFSTEETDFADGLSLDAEGNVYVSGAKSQIILLCAGNTGKVFLAKLDGQTGGEIWHTESDGGSGNTTRHFIKVDKQGQYCYFTGAYKYGMLLGSNLYFVGNDCDYHLYVGKMDAQTGAVLWWNDCSTGDFYPRESALGADGTIYLGGYSSLYSDPVAQVCGDTLIAPNGFLAGFDPDQGNLTSLQVLSTPTGYGGTIQGVFASENGALSVCGYAAANASIGNHQITSPGQTGGFIAQTAPAQPCSGGPITFDVGEGQSVTNSVLELPLRVLNFVEATSFGFTVEVDNLAVASIVGQADYNLAGLDASSFNILNNGKHLLVSWITPDGLGKTLPDSTVIFKILLKINAADSVCTPVSIVGAPLSVEVTQTPTGFDPAPYLLIDGEVCVKIRGDVRGMILTEDAEPVKDAIVTMQGPASGQSVTDQNGNYSISQMPFGSYVLTPAKNINPANGVTAFDLALINQHILQIAFLNSPYKIIAADANKNGSISPVDILILKQLILGMISDFPNNISWRFVPKNYMFPDPANPFSQSFPEHIDLLNFTYDFFDGDFIGIKIGDVDLDADGQLKPALGQPALIFAFPAMRARTGETLSIPVQASGFENITAWQFGMQYDPNLLEFVGVISGALLIGNESVFAKNGKLGLVWFDPNGNKKGVDFQNGEVVFWLKFKVVGSTAASTQDVTLGSDHIQSLAFKPDGTPVHIDWTMVETSVSLEELSPGAVSSKITVSPNPFSTSATISFSVDTNSEVVKTLFDSYGRVIFQTREMLPKGRHEWIVRDTDLSVASGTLFYQIEANGETRRGTLIKI